MMKESIKSVAPVYGTNALVKEYTRAMYAPCVDRHQKNKRIRLFHYPRTGGMEGRIESPDFGLPTTASRCPWLILPYAVKPGDQAVGNGTARTTQPGCQRRSLLRATVQRPYHRKSVDKYVGRQTDSGAWHYEATLRLSDGGEYGYTFRVIPGTPIK